MKKILSFMAIAMILMGLSACSGGGAASTPESAVKNALSAMKSANVKALVDACCDSQGNPSVGGNAQEEKQAETVLKMFSDLEYTVGAATINGNRAQVKVNMKFMGQQDDITLECIKGSDGKWRVNEDDLFGE